jgi:arylsulfatase A-like enzyme
VRNAFFKEDLFDVAKSLGYKTGLVGKNHTYLTPEELDFWREFNDLAGWQPANPPRQMVDFDNWRRALNFGVSPVPTPFPLETQFSYRVASCALEFLEKFGNEPFVLEVSFPEPHDPEQVPEPYWNMFPPETVPAPAAGPEALKLKGFQWQWMRGLQEHFYPGYDSAWRRYVSNYLGSLRMVDDQLGRVLAYLDQRQLLAKTLIVYVADHGDFLMEYGLMRKGVGMPEALIRIPMIWSGCGVKPPVGPAPVFVSIADVMPTLCEAMGAEIPQGVQGRSLWPVLQGREFPEEEFRSVYAESGFGGLYYDGSDEPPYSVGEFHGPASYQVPGQHKTFDELNSVTQSGYMKMLRKGNWKLIYDMMGYGQLYNLSSDPSELKNLFGDPSVASEQMQLLAELLMWNIRTQDSLPTGIYQTKWAKNHNWYTPYRQGQAPRAFIP